MNPGGGFVTGGLGPHVRAHIGYECAGEVGAVPVILLHGFPYDVRAFDEVAAVLAAKGTYVLAPYLRGFGSTRFQHDTTMRSGQQAALAQDLLDFMDALDIDTAVLAGYDSGGRAACIAAAVRPGRVRGLVTVDGYNVQDLAHAGEPTAPEWERKYWYQYYFHSERGRRAGPQPRRLRQWRLRRFSDGSTGAQAAWGKGLFYRRSMQRALDEVHPGERRPVRPPGLDGRTGGRRHLGRRPAVGLLVPEGAGRRDADRGRHRASRTGRTTSAATSASG